MNKKVILLILTLVIIAVAIYILLPKPHSDESIGLNKTTEQENIGVDIGQKAPTFTLKTFDGQEINSAKFTGKAIFIDFWANWCPFCHKEVPEIVQLRKQFSEDDLVILGIHRSATESRNAANSFLADKNVNYLILSDPNDEVYRTFTKGKSLMPFAVFIDKAGLITATIPGPKTLEQMQQEIEKILN